MAVRKKSDQGGSPRGPESKKTTKSAPSSLPAKPAAASAVKSNAKSSQPAASKSDKPSVATGVATAKKTAAKPKSRSEAVIEELQTVGADFVPSVAIEADAEAATLAGAGAVLDADDTSLSDAGPILGNGAPNDVPASQAKSAAPKAAMKKGTRATSAKKGATPPSPTPAPEQQAASEAPTALEASVSSETLRALFQDAGADARAAESISRSETPTTNDETSLKASIADSIAQAVGEAQPETIPHLESEPAPQEDAAPAEVVTTSSAELTDWDIHLFREGTHHKLWEKLGSHLVDGGVRFAVWAPNATSVSVVGDFNEWNTDSHPLTLREGAGIWEGFIPDLGRGTTYKYHIVSRYNDYRVNKADPFSVLHETPPETASKVWDLDYQWNDGDWMASRQGRNTYTAPMSIYEVHLGSWRRVSEDGETWRSMSYRELAEPLAEYVKKMNFTHIELMPIMEHPFYGSWGYQVTGYFAPTSRYGTPQDLKYLIDVLHQNGIGVIIDWVPSHFPSDEHSLTYFDGTHLFEHADPRKGFQPDWNSLIFNYGRNEVRSFLLSSALYWLGEYHADGLRVDAVASMLYLDYSRKAGEWVPNEFGGRENIEAISFLRRLNEDVYKVHPDVQVIAEESTAWPMVSRPLYVGGLGFGMKWDMGWMHDTLRYFARDPIHRRFHHNDLTFRMMYAFTENFVLPLSHDEVVHGKGSLWGKMPGDDWRRAANLRLLFSHMYANPGKKLMFMGGEFGQVREWNHDASLDWHLLEDPFHAGVQRWVEDLNKAYRDEPALHELDMSPDGFEWIDCCDTENSVTALLRRSSQPGDFVVAVMNFTPSPRHNYQIGLPVGGHWDEILNSDAEIYGGSAQGNMGGVDAVPIPLHGRRWSATLTLPPLGAVFLRSTKTEENLEDGGEP